MSDWMIRTIDKVRTLHISPCDTDAFIDVEQHFNGELYYFIVGKRRRNESIYRPRPFGG